MDASTLEEDSLLKLAFVSQFLSFFHNQVLSKRESKKKIQKMFSAHVNDGCKNWELLD